ncbi:MAG: YciI family protein [Planctomycetota bacterium]
MAKFTMKFMLAFHDDPRSFDDLTPEQMQQIVQRYNDWAGKLAQEGRMVAGEKLTDEPGKVMRRSGNDTTVTDGPFSETKEVFGGFFIIHANSYEDAVAVSQDCPHLEHGGTIELRAVEAS